MRAHRGCRKRPASVDSGAFGSTKRRWSPKQKGGDLHEHSKAVGKRQQLQRCDVSVVKIGQDVLRSDGVGSGPYMRANHVHAMLLLPQSSSLRVGIHWNQPASLVALPAGRILHQRQFDAGVVDHPRLRHEWTGERGFVGHRSGKG